MFEALQNPLIPLATFLLGVLLGHRTALWRDKRQEFNEAADPVRAWLLSEQAAPNWRSRMPDLVAIDRMEQRMPLWRRKGFMAAWQRQKQAREQALQRGASGGAQFGDTQAVRATVGECLRYTRRW